MNALEAFSPDYDTARRRFREAARNADWHESLSPDRNLELTPFDGTLDAARIGPRSAKNLLVVSGGLHGVEGFLGSAVQLSILEHRPKLPADTAILLLHALNPYGFAALRRVDENGVDLNRNFLEPDEFAALREQSLAGAYKLIDPFLNPPGPPPAYDPFLPKALYYIARLGWKTILETLPVGQYAFPGGLFYGGESQSPCTRLIMRETLNWVGSASRVIHLDVHTGLGPWGKGTLLGTEGAASPRTAQADAIFGKKHTSPAGQISGGYHTIGDYGPWVQRHLSDRDYLYLTAEFGTASGMTVVSAMRAENRAHRHASTPPDRLRAVKSRFREAFMPSSTAWRWGCVNQTLRFVQSALKHWA